MSRIFVCGDTHGIIDAKKLLRLKEKENLSQDDYIIICGDAGIVWSKDSLKDHIDFFEGLNLFTRKKEKNFFSEFRWFFKKTLTKHKLPERTFLFIFILF